MDDVGVQKFYTGQTIFLTGATGFVGRVIIEKLLRTCPNVKRLYLLIRTKKGKDSRQRINEIFDNPLFERMKKENQHYKTKVTVISGDLTMPDIGISESDRKLLIDEVTVVFHGAATVRFDEKLKTTININVSGTKNILQLCSECRKLKALVHISTAYANCNRDEVDEMIYPPPISADKVIALAEYLPDEMMERCTETIIQGWPNTYTFTKQIVEDLVNSEAISKNIPTAIYRPAIVVGAYSEPIPGWIDNIYGPTGVTAAVGAGIMRTLQADEKLKAELVPIDMTVNLAFAIAWDVSRCNRNGKILPDAVPVYNYVTAKDNPVTWGDFKMYNLRHGYDCPSVKSLWYYSQTMTRYRTLYYIYSIFLHLLPALIVDLVLLARRQKPQALNVYKKVHKFSKVIAYFSTKQWVFKNDNVMNLWTKLSKEDQLLFNFDMSVIDWNLFFKNNIAGVKTYLFHDTPDTLPVARRRMFIFYILDRLIKIVFVSIVVWLLWTPVSLIFNFVVNMLFSGKEDTHHVNLNYRLPVSLKRVG